MEELDEQSEGKTEARKKKPKVALVDVEVIDAQGRSALVEYDNNGMPMRAYVDTLDLQDGACPAERLEDAPYGIQWAFNFNGLGREVELALKNAGIWTYEDLMEKDRAIIRIATNLLGHAIWETAKRACKSSES